MRNLSFSLAAGRVGAAPPFAYQCQRQPPWRWTVVDARGRLVGEAKTRAGVRGAVRALYAEADRRA